MRHLSEYQSFQCILWSHEAKIAQHSLVDTVGEFLILKEVRSFASFLNVLHQITTDGKFKSVSYSEFGRLAPQIRQLCLFSFPNSKRLQLSEKIIHSSCSPTFLSSVRLQWSKLSLLVCSAQSLRCLFADCQSRDLTIDLQNYLFFKRKLYYLLLLDKQTFRDHQKQISYLIPHFSDFPRAFLPLR